MGKSIREQLSRGSGLICLSLATLFISCRSPSTASGPGGASPGCTPKDEFVIDDPAFTPPVHQDADKWCWAASAQMVMAYYKQKITQCQEVDERYPKLNCCSANHRDPKCGLYTGWPNFCAHGLNVSIKHGQGLTWDEVKQQIWCRKSPIAFSWHWLGGNGADGHMMVAVGYGADSQDVTDRYLTVNDPTEGLPQKVFYSEYLPIPDSNPSHLNYKEHTHWDDFYNFQTDSQVRCSAQNDDVLYSAN